MVANESELCCFAVADINSETMFTNMRNAVCYDTKMQRLGIFRMSHFGYHKQVSASPLVDARINALHKMQCLTGHHRTRTIGR